MARNKRLAQANTLRKEPPGDEEIRRAVASDPDAPPIATAEWMRQANVLDPQNKVAVSIRMDEEVLDWFRKGGRGYQSRMNSVLRAFVETYR